MYIVKPKLGEEQTNIIMNPSYTISLSFLVGKPTGTETETRIGNVVAFYKKKHDREYKPKTAGRQFAAMY